MFKTIRRVCSGVQLCSDQSLLNICSASHTSILALQACLLHTSVNCHAAKDLLTIGGSLDTQQQQAPQTIRTRRRVTKEQHMCSKIPSAAPSPVLAQVVASGLQSHAQLTQPLDNSDGNLLQQHAATGNLYHKVSGSTVDLITMLRRHNHSLPNLPGQVVLARVLHMAGDRVYVDAGFHSLSELYRPELGITHIHKPHASAPMSSRVGTSDVRVGDVIKVKIEALYTPYGDMQLQAPRHDAALELHARWVALAERAAAGQPVQGRVLNQCRGGYAVGVAGFVGLLPYQRASSTTCQKIGTLETFYVERMDEKRQTLLLSDARLPQKGRDQRRNTDMARI